MMFLVASKVGNQLHKSLSFTSLSLLLFFNKQNHRGVYVSVFFNFLIKKFLN